MAVEVTARVCAFNDLTGVKRFGSDEGSGSSAEMMLMAKSLPAVRRTREEGKKRTDVTEER